MLAAADQPNHVLSIAEIAATQKSSDDKWNNVPIAYWGTADLVDGKGTQTGYFVDDHGADGRDWGTFEGQCSVAGGATTIEGTWRYTGGSGKFAGITGQGAFKSKLTPPVDVECSWQGVYELVATRAHGR
jgi:hypothetical protein